MAANDKKSEIKKNPEVIKSTAYKAKDQRKIKTNKAVNEIKEKTKKAVLEENNETKINKSEKGYIGVIEQCVGYQNSAPRGMGSISD
jgi:hypothetical protein